MWANITVTALAGHSWLLAFSLTLLFALQRSPVALAEPPLAQSISLPIFRREHISER